MGIFDVFVAFVQGIVEGITEWLPVSSTGHMILVNEFLKFHGNEEFNKMFIVVIQLGAILAVALLFWKKLWPFHLNNNEEKGPVIKWDIMSMWLKIIVACIPAAIVGILFDDFIDAHFYNPPVVAAMLIIYGVLFIVVEIWHKGKKATTTSIADITYKDVLLIGLFQLLAAIFPGTSRSGATILGALLLGISRPVAAEFTFFLAVPVMFGASLLKIGKYAMTGLGFGPMELVVLLTGCLVAFIVSLFVIKFLMNYIRKHDFKIFGYYRIVLGVLVLLYFLIFG